MNDFVRCNKLTGIYWLQGTIDNLKIKIKLKHPDDIISLPTFEDYTNETGNISLEQNIREFSFGWQEKCFSEFEVQRYKDIHKCVSEHELKYHESLISKEIVPSKVFTYVHEDYYSSLPREKQISVSLLTSCLERLSWDGALSTIGDAINGKSASRRHLFKSQEDIGEEEEKWIAMHVMLDNSDYNNERIVVKREAPLLSVYHNTGQNYVLLSPDTNQLEYGPYVVETSSGDELPFQYAVAVEVGVEGASADLATSASKLHNKWEKNHEQLVGFELPPLGSARFHLTIEIVSARGFTRDNLYIEYHIEPPDGTKCVEAECLHGRSHASEPSEASEGGGARVYHYGHAVDVCLETECGTAGAGAGAGAGSAPLIVYLEAISTDVWRRHRTAGYASLRVPLVAGPVAGPAGGPRPAELRCVLPREAGSEERSLFLGGCHLLDELEALSRADAQKGNYTYIESGRILVRATTVVQRALPPAGGGGGGGGGGAGAGGARRGGGGSAAALLVGAEEALRRYKRARARLAHATTTTTTTITTTTTTTG